MKPFRIIAVHPLTANGLVEQCKTLFENLDQALKGSDGKTNANSPKKDNAAQRWEWLGQMKDDILSIIRRKS